MFVSSVKEINGLLSKEMSKNRRSQNLYSLKFENFASGSVFGELQLTQISLNCKTFCCT